MAPVMCIAASTRSATATSARMPARAAVAVPRPTVFAVAPKPRSSIIRFSSDTGAENDDKLVGEHGEILQGKQDRGGSNPMKEGESQGAQQSSKPVSDVTSSKADDAKTAVPGQVHSDKVPQQQQDKPPST